MANAKVIAILAALFSIRSAFGCFGSGQWGKIGTAGKQADLLVKVNKNRNLCKGKDFVDTLNAGTKFKYVDFDGHKYYWWINQAYL